MYCMAMIAMMLLAVACENGSSRVSDHRTTVQDMQLTSPAIVKNEEAKAPPPIREQDVAKPENAFASADSTAFNTEDYDHIVENKFLSVKKEPLSTFSIDVDRAAYSNVRRFIESGQLPPKGAVRIEEMINYFDYHYAPPTSDDPFAVYTETASCPWNEKHKIVHIGLQGKKMATEELPPSNLVFLIDVSGSMDEPNKLPLVQQSLKLLTGQLRSQDKVAIVVYAGSAGLVLSATSGDDKGTIEEAINNLHAGGSTAGGEGIALAYNIAEQNKKKDGNNRIILATDGDFNVGARSDDELVSLIEKERQRGIYLSVLGFGTGNYKDNKMQQLADKGNGNHNYIDDISEARKVLVNEFGGTLFTIAKDVKLQVEFNPSVVSAYRLIGYENRALANEDFNDDKKDAGELGSGHTVTALYEIIPTGIKDTMTGSVDDLKYQTVPLTNDNNSHELMTIKMRYKKPDGEKSQLMVYPVVDENKRWEDASDNFKLSASVAEFGLLLLQSSYRQNSSFSQTFALAKDAGEDDDEHGYRAAYIKLVKEASSLHNRE